MNKLIYFLVMFFLAISAQAQNAKNTLMLEMEIAYAILDIEQGRFFDAEESLTGIYYGIKPAKLSELLLEAEKNPATAYKAYGGSPILIAANIKSVSASTSGSYLELSSSDGSVVRAYMDPNKQDIGHLHPGNRPALVCQVRFDSNDKVGLKACVLGGELQQEFIVDTTNEMTRIQTGVGGKTELIPLALVMASRVYSQMLDKETACGKSNFAKCKEEVSVLLSIKDRSAFNKASEEELGRLERQGWTFE